MNCVFLIEYNQSYHHQLSKSKNIVPSPSYSILKLGVTVQLPNYITRTIFNRDSPKSWKYVMHTIANISGPEWKLENSSGRKFIDHPQIITTKFQDFISKNVGEDIFLIWKIDIFGIVINKDSVRNVIVQSCLTLKCCNLARNNIFWFCKLLVVSPAVLYQKTQKFNFDIKFF